MIKMLPIILYNFFDFSSLLFLERKGNTINNVSNKKAKNENTPALLKKKVFFGVVSDINCIKGEDTTPGLFSQA